MSVRSFDQIVRSPEPHKLSTLLVLARAKIAAGHSSYICNAVSAALWDVEGENFEGTYKEVERIGAFLESQGISTHGGFVSQRFNEIGAECSRNEERATRLAVLDVLIHQLLQRGE